MLFVYLIKQNVFHLKQKMTCKNSKVNKKSLFFFQYSTKYSKFIDPCAQIKCASNQICIPKDDFTASCILRDQVELDQNLFFNKRSIETKTQLCGDLECRFGVCEALNETNYTCHCSKVIFMWKFFDIFNFVI